MLAYYNEIDTKKAAWLKELQKTGAISKGGVDTRSIADLATPTLIAGLGAIYEAHFFAGIGVWARALRQAGWPDGVRVWTGSCPCQSFSASGQRRGFSDKRHLWPAWFRLISECRPDVLFGEQVASPDGLAWFDVVSTDLEGAGYTVGVVDTCAAGFGAPHIRQRLYFVAYAKDNGRQWLEAFERRGNARNESAECRNESSDHGAGNGAVADSGGSAAIARDHCGETGAVANSAGERLFSSALGRVSPEAEGQRPRDAEPEYDCIVGDASSRGLGVRGSASRDTGRPALASETDGLDDASSARSQGHPGDVDRARRESPAPGPAAAAGALNGFWSDAEWIWCRDGKYRPAKPGIFPLAHGIVGRVGLLRGYGDAIVLPQAQAFIEVFMEEMGWLHHQ